MNGNYKEVKVKITVEVDGDDPVFVERTVRYYDTVSLERELEDLNRSAGKLAECVVRQEVVVQVR